MCMLFIKPEGLELPLAYFNSLKANNADGVSCYNFDTKELFQTLDYKEAYQYLVDNKEVKLVVHFRFGTSGVKTLDQLHGWDILEGKYHFFHNGVMNGFAGTKLQSDTQQFVAYINKFNPSLKVIIDYLQSYEQSSRFIILDKETQEVIIPECAVWNEEIKINGCPVVFSNDYAISHQLQTDDGHLMDWKSSFNSKYRFSAIGNNHSHIDDDMDLFFNDEDDQDNDLDVGAIAEIEFLINDGSSKDLLDYILVNPDDIVKYLKGYA